jgi:hypothetical protein
MKVVSNFSFYYVKHNDKNRIKNKHRIGGILYFKV